MSDQESGFVTSGRPRSGSSRPARSLASRILRRSLLTTGLPLLLATLVVGGAGYWLAGRVDQRVEQAQAGLTEDAVGQLKADQSALVLDRLDDLIGRRVERLVVWSRSPELVEAASASYPLAAELLAGGSDTPVPGADEVLDTTGGTSRFLSAAQEAEPGFSQLLMTDPNGFTIGTSSPPTSITQAEEPWWNGAWAAGGYLGPAEIDEATGARAFLVAVRLDDAGGQPIGVLKGLVDLTAVQAVTDTAADPERGLSVVVASTEGQLLADTASAHDESRILGGAGFLDGRDGAYAQVLTSEAETGFLAVGETVSGYSRLAPTRAVPALGIELANPSWVVVVDQPTAQALAPASRLDGLERDIRRATGLATGAMAALAVLGLILAALLARTLSRRLVASLGSLRTAANRLAHHELPSLLRAPGGPNGHAAATNPLQVEGEQEVVEVAAAFNTLRSTAIDLAATQANDRDREVAGVLVNLGRRNQQLIGRQLRFIDDLERTESNPDTLRNLFALDQMATRMRRNAESLLVLAGEDSPRRGTQPRPVDEVVRAATSEVEDFARVVIGSLGAALVEPRTVSDLTHLLAELIENATLFSPPESEVDVRGEAAAGGGYTISIVDRGLGLPPERLDEANSRLSTATAPGAPAGSFMGLYVVGRLAARHDIEARLLPSPAGGTAALVHLPASCLSTGPEPTAEVRGSRLHVSGPLTGPPPSRSGPPPPAARRTRPPVEPRRPVRPGQPVPDEAEPLVVAAHAGGPGTGEDEGRPIPPFKSRPSRRGEGDHAAGNGEGAEVDPENRRFQVRRRVRRTPAPVAGSLDPQIGSASHGEARATEVRDKLNRFASGVEAAKARRTLAPRTNGSGSAQPTASDEVAGAGEQSEPARDPEES